MKRQRSAPTREGWPCLAWPLWAALALSLAAVRPCPSPIGTEEVTLAAVGDILLDRGVEECLVRYGVGYPFRKVAPLLAQADLAFGNLECPLSQEGKRATKPIAFRADPSRAACLRQAGLDVLSLANNHAMDCGRSGLVETMAHLRRKRLRWCGAGLTQAQAEGATVLRVRGLRVAFVGFCQFLPETGFLREDRPTIAFASSERVRRAVREARRQSDVVVASFHWGVEYQRHPTPRQEILAKEAVRAGAKLVIGHHPHVLQRVEPFGSHTVVAYSLGNFVFDSHHPEACQSAVLRVRLSRRGVEHVEAIPVQIQQCQPRLLSQKEGEGILLWLGIPEF